MKTKKAFTLVELLVVISIIAVLLSILMPALGRVREQGRMVVCRNNEKSLFYGATFWSNDHDGWAIAGDWYKDVGDNETESSLGPYIGAADKKKENSVKVCPTAVHSNFYHTDTDFNSIETRYTYASNGYITFNMTFYGEGSPGKPGPRGMGAGGLTGPGGVFWTEHGLNKMVDIRKPADTAFFIDHEYYTAISWTFNPTQTIAVLTAAHPTYKFTTRWHFKKPNKDYGVGNIGWVDGHVSVEPSDFAKKIGPADPEKHLDERWRYYFYAH